MSSFTEDVRDPDGEKYKFSPAERQFIEHYLTDPKHNATAAAIAAGYKADNPGAIRAQASKLMARPKIRAAINQAFESLALPKMEIIYRLGRIAAGSVTDVMNEDNELDLDGARERGTDWLIRKIERRRKILEIKATDIDAPADDGETLALEKHIIEETVKFEIHDPLKALELLGKHGKLFVERKELTGKDGKDLVSDQPQVVFYIPDNGRGDSDGVPAALADLPSADARTVQGPGNAGNRPFNDDEA